MKEKFSEEYNLILQLNHQKKVICENLFLNFRNSRQSFQNLFDEEYLKSDICDLIEPSTFKQIIEEYYDDQKLIADTIHDLTDPSTFEDAIEEYYEIQKCIIDNVNDISDTTAYNEKDIEKNIQELIEPLSFDDPNYIRRMEEERIIRNTDKIFSHSFFKNINKIFDNIHYSNSNIRVIVNDNMSLNISQEEFYKKYEKLAGCTEYTGFEKIEISSFFCIVYSLSSVYCVLSNESILDLQKFIAEFQILAHFYVKNINLRVFQFFKDPKKIDLIMPRHSAPLLFWFLLKFIVSNFPKWG